MPKRSLAVLVALACTLPNQQARRSDRRGQRWGPQGRRDYVEGFYEGDSTKHLRSVRPDVFKYGFWLPRDSTRYQGEAMPSSETPTATEPAASHEDWPGATFY